MIKVILMGHGMVANHLAVGIERIKSGEIEPYGVPFANHKLRYDIGDIEIVASYDVDRKIIGKSFYKAAKEAMDASISIPSTLKDIYVRKGIHLGSLDGMPVEIEALEDKLGLRDAIYAIVDEWREFRPDVIVNIITTEHGYPFRSTDELLTTLENGGENHINASQAYALAAALYSRQYNPVAFVNGIPMTLANDDILLKYYERSRAVIFGDDGATGATPLTADILEHLANRNRHVKFIVQFNIGGNKDFLALTIPEKNMMKEKTKSSIVKDILGYDVPNYIKPTGYLEPLGDKKFISMHIEYNTFNGMTDDLYIAGRINDSPAMAGGLVDLIRFGKIAVDEEMWGTVYDVNAFFMKKPGPREAKSIAKIIAYHKLLHWLKSNNALTADEDIELHIDEIE